MLDNCKWNAAMPFVCRAAYRGVISSINFTLITSAQTMLRQEQTLNPGIGGIDGYNEFLASLNERDEEVRSQEEQGLVVQLNPRELGGMLKVVRAYLDEELRANASEVILALTNKRVLNPFEIGDTIENSLARLISRTPRELTAHMKLEAKALNKSEEVIFEALKRQQLNNAAYLATNRELILDIIEKMTFEDPNDLTAEAVWDRLPALMQLRLYAAADNGLYFESDRQAQRYILRGVQECKSNVGLVDGERRILRKEIEAFVAQPKIRRELSEAHAGGAVMPTLHPVVPAVEDTTRKVA